MIATRFTQLVGCAVPIQQAGMGAAAPPELAAAVSEAGALGMLGTARPGLTAITFADLLEQVRSLTARSAICRRRPYSIGVSNIVRPVAPHSAVPHFTEVAALYLTVGASILIFGRRRR